MKKLLALLGVSGVLTASAVDAVFNSPSTQQPYWQTAANWIDGATGQTLPVQPTNSTDNVRFTTPANTVYRQRIGTGFGSSTSQHTSFLINDVVGDYRHEICHYFQWQEGIFRPNCRLTVANPNGFTGYWYSGDSHAIFRFPGGEGFEPSISDMSANARPEIDIPATGTVARLGTLYNGGAMTKLGVGELIVGGTGGDDTRIYVGEGTVTLAGRAADDTCDAILARAALHLDASDASSLLKSSEAGRTTVTNWLDVRKNGVSATVTGPHGNLTLVNAPFMATGASDSGLDMVDFGSALKDAGSIAAWGPTNCTMSYTRFVNAREVFYVAKYHTRPGFNSVLGDRDVQTLQPASRLLGGSANFGARTGAIFANGQKVDATFWPSAAGDFYGDGYGFTNQYVISFGSPSNMCFSTIASDLDIAERVGGVQVGEILIFTNELTRAERLRVNDHLLGKWAEKGVVTGSDVGQVFLQSEGVAIGVADGKKAKVTDLVSVSASIVKTGGGTLEVNAVYPTNAVLDVRAGSIRLSRSVPEVSASVAAAPVVHLDASVASTRPTTRYDGYDSDFVTTWTDCRGGENAIAATASPTDAPRKPTLVPGASTTGLDAIDFGVGTTYTSYFKFPWWGDGSKRFKAGFIVMRPRDAGSTYVPFFGSKDMTFMREGSTGGQHSRLISENYTHPALGSALWTLDGAPCDPTVYNGRLKQTAAFMVIAFSAREKVLVDAIAWGRNSANYCGGMQVGEFLLYDRELTDQERRDTEAYLMNKWLGAAHPRASAPVPSYNFAADVDAVIASDADVTVAGVAGGSGDVIKQGTGTVTLATVPAGDSFKSVSVEEGELVVLIKANFMNEALFHFDAMDTESLVYAQGDGGTNVLTKWLDVRRNGTEATTVTNDAKGWVKRAPSITQIETRGGVTRPMLNFGVVLGGNSAAMFMNGNFLNVREAHAIHKDIGLNSMYFTHSRLNPACNGLTQEYYDFFRTAASQSFLGDAAAASLKNGYMATNGAPVAAYNDPVPAAATLFSVAAAADVHVNSIQYDRTVPGGAYVGEQLAFPRALTPEERGYLQRHLIWKWFNEGSEPVWTNACLTSLAVAKGAALTFDGTGNIFVDELRGAGTVTAAELMGVTALTVTDTCGLAVDGKVTFGSSVSVKLSAVDTMSSNCGGEYPLVTATAFGNLDLSKWSFDQAVHPDISSVKFTRRGDTVYLILTKRTGTMILMR